MNIAIILSGGVGSRMGSDLPKQYMIVDGKPVIHYCMKTFLEVQEINAITIVVADEWRGFVEETISKMNPGKPVFYAQPGETRQFSIFSGLKEALNNGASDDDIVIIHDAARPMVSVGLISECLKGCSDADGVLPVIPVKDTLYQSKDGHNITSLLNRSELFAGQAPEAFLFGKYYALHNEMSHDDILKINGSTEIAYKGGLQIKLIRGDEMNFKITTPEDLSNFDSIIRAKGL
jgi:2-C-methyl-D-erythritol 4-phosphate cytidylyltransferase